MSAGNETGGVAAPPATARLATSGWIGRYHGPVDPHKVAHFIVDGQPVTTRGKVAAFLRAMIAAGNEGVAHVEVMPWLHNASDAASALKHKGIGIDTRKGQPSRWVLVSNVREVLR